MSAVADRGGGAPPRSLWRALPRGYRNVLLIAAITLLALPWQLRWGTVPDTSWLITVCERMLSGERLYVDLYETNPPFSVWLYMPPVAIAGMIGVASEYAVHLWTYLLAAAGLLLAGHVVRRGRFAETEQLRAMAPAFYAMLVLYPAIAFSEREHIGAALFLPLLALMAWRARTDAPTKPGLPLAIAVGFAGSILLLVKPHYAVMVLAPAIFVCRRKKSAWPLFAVEHWVIGIMCSAYLACVLLIYPEFIRDIFPVVSDVYMKVRLLVPILVKFCLPMSVLMFMIWRLWPRQKMPELASVATLAACAGLIPVIVQGKGWAYHGYPAMLCAICALLCLLALPPEDRRCAAWTGRQKMLMKPNLAVLLLGVLASFAAFWPTQKPTSVIVSAIHQATDGPTLALIGSDLATGHPLARMVGGHWAETYVSDWLGASALYLFRDAQLGGDQAEASRYRSILDRYAAQKRQELLSRRPDILLVQKDEPYWLDILVKRYGFDEILSSYRVLSEDDEVRVYLRNDPGRDRPEA
jgi:hypothetical protein